MLTLEQIIDNSRDSREVKRALAVKMALKCMKNSDIADFLQVSESFINKWNTIYEQQGAEALQLRYKGSEGYLSSGDKEEIISFLKNKLHYSVEELRDYVEENYHVVYKSKQSYYELLEAAGISWKKTEKINPKKDEERVTIRREEIKQVLQERSEEIESGDLVVFLEDECHLRWGDVCGYVWGRTNEKVEVPIINEKERQTYYGAVDYQTKEFYLQAYSAGNSSNTVSFIKYLQNKKPDSKLMFIWDGASYHTSEEMRTYLQEVNEGLEKKDWKITCVLLAPHAPEENPVEDVWLKGKNFLRKHFFENKTFAKVKKSFFNFLNGEVFDFPKLSLYG